MVNIINKIHLIHGDNNENILFHYPTYSLICVNDNVYNVIDSLQRGIEHKTILDNYEISEEEYNNIFTKLDENFSSLNSDPCQYSVKVKPNEIQRITVHISNDCNLRCKYCYGNGGDYHQKRGYMTQDTALKFIDFCIKNFSKINTIVFFGGEPFLNIKIIEFICNRFKELSAKQIIDYIPSFGIITNGTIINEKILSIVKLYISFITVSIDGPKIVNDYNRVYLNGKGSYDDIINFIKVIKKETDIPISYEATYTTFHVKKGYNIAKLRQFFEELDIKGVVVPEINCKGVIGDNFIIQTKDTGHIYTNDDFKKFSDDFWTFLAILVNKQAKSMCQIHQQIFAISTEGDIYPCHMNNGISHLSLGNIDSKNIYNAPDDFYIKNPLLKIIDDKNKLCGDCWAKYICGGCSMRWFYDSTLDKYNTTPNNNLCKESKSLIEKYILLVSNIRRNPESWNNLLIYLKINLCSK